MVLIKICTISFLVISGARTLLSNDKYFKRILCDRLMNFRVEFLRRSKTGVQQDVTDSKGIGGRALSAIPAVAERLLKYIK
jgi:hypothetical protein